MQPDNYSQTSSNAEQSPKNGLKKTAKLHEISSKATAAIAPEDDTRLPSPENRQAAGNVIRRTDNTAPVAPPPRVIRQDQTPRPARRLNRGRGNARKLGQNDGDDSDSDSDKNRNRVRSESPGNAKRPPRTVEEPQGSSLAESEMRAKEESERLELHRTLKSIGRYWTAIDQRRRLNADEGHKKKTDLLNPRRELKISNDDERFQYSEKCREIKTWDDKTRIFLDVALETAFGNFLGNRFYQRKSSIGNILAGTPSSSPLEVIAREVEAEVIWRLNIFTPARDFGRRDSDIVRYLTITIKTLYEFLRYCMPMTHSSEESVINSAAQLVRDMSEVSTTKNFINTLVDSYMSKIIREFAQPFWFHLLRGEYDSMRKIRYTAFRRSHLYPISLSRQNGHLEDEYITWVTGGMDESDAQKQYMEEQSNLKLNKVESYESMEDTRQEFIMHPSKPRVVSLILLKGTNPVIVRDVPTAELSSLGWFPDDTGLSYWRYKLHMTQDEFGIFKVSMDDEVLEAWRPVNRGLDGQNP